MRHQRGLSLILVAVVMGVLALVAALALISMRTNRNIFAEAWVSLAKSAPIQQVQQVATTPAPPIRKCTMGGKVVYSNVDCPGNSPSGQAVELYDTRGVEAPKVPPAPPASEAADKGQELRDKAIERAVSR